MSHTINNAEYAVTPEGAVFRNGIQVVIPAEGADVLGDLVELARQHDLSRDKSDPVVDLQLEEKGDYSFTAPKEAEPGPRVLHWKGFNATEVPGGDEDHPRHVAVVHEALSSPVLRFVDEPYARRFVMIDGTYGALCAKAALAWFRHFEPAWREWKAGDVVHNEGGESAFISTASTGELILIGGEGFITPLHEDVSEQLALWWLE